MNSSRKVILQISIVAIITVSFLSYWEFVQIPEHNKLSQFYTLDQEYLGQNQLVDDVYGELSSPYILSDSLIQKVIEQNGDNLTIVSTVSSKNIVTDKVLFSATNTYNIDAKTRMHLDRDGKLYGFPTGVEKKEYDFFHPAIYFDDPMRFIGIDVIDGLDVYIFETVTIGADISYAFSQFSPHTIFTDTTSRLWVEPVTGNVISFEKTWENYLVEDGKRINTIELGEKQTSSFTEHVLAESTVIQMDSMYVNGVLIPILIFTLTLILGSIWILSTHLNRVNHASEKLLQKEKLKDEVVSMLTHEIKNPLTPIKSMCDLLLLEKDDPLTDKQRERIHVILNNSNALNDLLTDFGDVKKLDLDQVQLSKTEIDLKEYLATVIESVRPFTGDKHVKLTLNLKDSWKIICDQKRISQVISNLVKNAIDFIPANNGEIIINAEKDNQGTIISIQDNGIGIPIENAELIFDKFTQLENPKYIQHEGSGLGLAVCKGIVEAHGGRIWLDKNYESGTKIQFLIPK
jgi:signal transduction histidine kinase